MAKKKKRTKKKSSKKAAGSGTKRKSCKAFLQDLYERQPNVSNDVALERLLAKFPNSNASTKSIITWKCMLRADGVDIPLQRAGAKSKTAKKKKAKKKAKRKSAR